MWLLFSLSFLAGRAKEVPHWHLFVVSTQRPRDSRHCSLGLSLPHALPALYFQYMRMAHTHKKKGWTELFLTSNVLWISAVVKTFLCPPRFQEDSKMNQHCLGLEPSSSQRGKYLSLKVSTEKSWSDNQNRKEKDTRVPAGKWQGVGGFPKYCGLNSAEFGGLQDRHHFWH